jgi:hypothetical protein
LQVKQPVLTFGAFALDLFFEATCSGASPLSVSEAAAAIFIKMVSVAQVNRHRKMDDLTTDATDAEVIKILKRLPASALSFAFAAASFEPARFIGRVAILGE